MTCHVCESISASRTRSFTMGDGVTHQVPDMWLVGAVRGDRTLGQALAFWAEQCELAEQWEREQSA